MRCRGPESIQRGRIERNSLPPVHFLGFRLDFTGYIDPLDAFGSPAALELLSDPVYPLLEGLTAPESPDPNRDEQMSVPPR